MFKMLGNIGSLMKQAQEIGGRMKDLSEELRQQRTTASTAGGLVSIEVNGLGEALNVNIDPSLLTEDNAEMLGELLRGAFNQAAAKAKELHQQAMQDMTSDIDLPGLDQALSKMTGGDSDEEQQA